MMPNPLSSVLPKANVFIANAGDRPLLRHPELAALAAEAIASWAMVESFMLQIFVVLLGGLKEKAATVYFAIRMQSAKNAAIRAIAETTLSKNNFDLLYAILALSDSNQKSRDKLAHWIWGDSPDLPDALILADPTIVLDASISRDNLFVYKKQDFGQIIEANERLAGYCAQFKFHIIRNPNDNNSYKNLCSIPEIKERLEKKKSV